MECGDCKVDYPPEILNKMYLSGIGYTKPICGICALERSNQLSGETRTTFHGEPAEEFRQRAVQWRNKVK